MSLWNEITNTALIGCERKPLSLNRAADKLGGLLTQLDQSDREGALLGAAAIVSLYGRAGSLPSKDTLPLPEACMPDDAPRCSESVGDPSGNDATRRLSAAVVGMAGEGCGGGTTRAGRVIAAAA